MSIKFKKYQDILWSILECHNSTTEYEYLMLLPQYWEGIINNEPLNYGRSVQSQAAMLIFNIVATYNPLAPVILLKENNSPKKWKFANNVLTLKPSKM